MTLHEFIYETIIINLRNCYLGIVQLGNSIEKGLVFIIYI